MRKCLHNVLVLAQLDKSLPNKVRIEIRNLNPQAFVEDEAIALHKAIITREDGKAELLSCAEEAGLDLDVVADIISSSAYKMFMGQAVEQQIKAVKDVDSDYCRDAIIKNFEKAIEKFSGLNAQDDLVKELSTVIQSTLKKSPKSETVSLEEASAECLSDIAELKESGGQTYYPTPFKTLNKYIDGLVPGNVTTFCAFTSGGKTAMACFLAYYYATQGKRVLYLSSEVDAKKLNNKFTLIQSHIDGLSSFDRSNYLSLEDNKIEQLVKVINRVVEATGNKVDFQLLSTGEQVLMELAKADDYDVIILDHFHNLDDVGDVNYCDKLCAEIGRTTSKYRRTLLQMAQYNKTLGAKEMEPSAHHVKGSSALIQNSSVFMHMWAPEDKTGNKEKVYLKIEKNRDFTTPKNYIELHFMHSKQFFEDKGEVNPVMEEQEGGNDD